MKKQLFKSAAVKAYSTALLTSLILLSGFKASATETADTAKQSQVTYLGVTNDLVGFNVNFTNTASDRFVLELTDGEGQLLFYKRFSDKNFNRNVYLKNMTEEDRCKVKFTIKAGKNVFNEAFDINTKKTYVQDFVVTRL